MLLLRILQDNLSAVTVPCRYVCNNVMITFMGM